MCRTKKKDQKDKKGSSQKDEFTIPEVSLI
jgi:hypothetical protein